MTKPKYKYNINHHISLLPRAISIAQFEEILRKDHGITRDSFYRDRNIQLSSDTSIPSDRLEVYAGLFGVSVDELKNYEVKKIKPLAERRIKPIEKKLGIKSK
jgi:hypothetical protein